MDLKTYQKVKENVEELQRRHDRAEGALQQLSQRLKTEFDCDTIEEAEAKLNRLEFEAKEASDELDRAFESFKQEWSDALDI